MHRIGLILAVALSLAAVACGGGDESKTAAPTGKGKVVVVGTANQQSAAP